MKTPAVTAAPSPRRKARWWQVRPRILLIIYLVALAAMMIFEESLIFHPLRYPAGEWQPAGLVVEDAEFTSADGTRLHGWFVPHGHPRAVVLFAPGNAGNITYRTDRLRRFHRTLDAAVMIFDYRGYGRSEGRPNERGVLADARAARRWLAERTGVAETDIVLVGESLCRATTTTTRCPPPGTPRWMSSSPGCRRSNDEPRFSCRVLRYTEI